LTSTRFDELDLPPEVIAGLRDVGFEHCTPIQAQALAILLDGRDVAGQAQTGTGKTAAFLVTVIARMLRTPDRQAGVPQALIMAPTRELSHQILEEAQALSRHTDISLLEVVGGIDYREQAEGLKKGTDIVIGTPGRIIDYYKQGIFKTDEIKFLVIDEADRLLDLGFEKDMRYILRKLPRYDKRQSMLFSATLSHRVLELTYEFMNLPEFISVTPDTVTVAGIEQALYHVGKDRKLSLLLGLLKREEFARALIFVNMKVGVERLTRKLKGNGFPAEGISGDLPQRKRFQLMDRFKSGQIKILVATDVASRGIHVEDISHVVNYDLPQDAENYVHRIGRTARAGKTGKAISLACEDYVLHLEPMENLLGYKIPVVWPEEDWFVEDRARREAPARREPSARREAPARRGRGERVTGRRDQDQDRNRGRGRGTQRPPRAAAAEAPKVKRFPGAFFGFKPPSEDPGAGVVAEAEKPGADIITEVENPAADLAAEAEKPDKPAKAESAESAEQAEQAERTKKRRRRRRKKKPASPEPGSGSPGEIQPPSPSESTPAAAENASSGPDHP
jgi:ATP-dependent RNA helicase RhlB